MNETFDQACKSVVETKVGRWAFVDDGRDGEVFTIEFREHDEYDQVSDPYWALLICGDWVDWNEVPDDAKALLYKEIPNDAPSGLYWYIVPVLRELWNGKTFAEALDEA